ncbi:MAG: chalcone isomerase family protein [Parvibaculaceae bacterium]|nr:chalcone isomerase family protein [Parvibaculaceae bacterium]
MRISGDYLRRLFLLSALPVLLLNPSTPRAATLEGVQMPDSIEVGGATLKLNGMALRTYSWLGIKIYVAGLYLENPAGDADTILNSPEKKVLVVHFLRDITLDQARNAWKQGFSGNCLAPCHINPGELNAFLANVTKLDEGDSSTLIFTPDAGVEVDMNGKRVHDTKNPDLVYAMLATFIGPKPPSQDVKLGLLGKGE